MLARITSSPAASRCSSREGSTSTFLLPDACSAPSRTTAAPSSPFTSMLAVAVVPRWSPPTPRATTRTCTTRGSRFPLSCSRGLNPRDLPSTAPESSQGTGIPRTMRTVPLLTTTESPAMRGRPASWASSSSTASSMARLMRQSSRTTTTSRALAGRMEPPSTTSSTAPTPGGASRASTSRPPRPMWGRR